MRLKNIFSGPKKRPPVLFLALMFSACLLCGNLVSCQMAQAEEPEGSTSIAPDSSASVPVDELPSVSDGQEWLTAELGNFISPKWPVDEPDQYLTPAEAALLENLPVDELPREAVEVFHVQRQDYWQDMLLPVAYDEGTDATFYFVVDPDSMPNIEPGASPDLWSMKNCGGIVLRQGDRTAYFPLSWDINAKFGASPPLLVDDLDSDGKPEAALALIWGEGTGCLVESLYIFDLDTMTCNIPDYANIPLEITYDPDKTRARLVSGDKELEVRLDGLALPFEGKVDVGDQVQFLFEDGQILCELGFDFTCRTLDYLAFAKFPVVYEDGVYKLGPAVSIGDVL